MSHFARVMIMVTMIAISTAMLCMTGVFVFTTDTWYWGGVTLILAIVLGLAAFRDFKLLKEGK